jgi:hypothetical protein
MRRAHHNSALNGHCGTHVVERLPERLVGGSRVGSTAPGDHSTSKVAERRPSRRCNPGNRRLGQLCRQLAAEAQKCLAPAAIALVRATLVQAALPHRDPARSGTMPPSARTLSAPMTCSSTPEARQCLSGTASPAHPVSPRSSFPPPRPSASSTSPATGKPASSPALTSPPASAGHAGDVATRSAPAGTTTAPRQLSRDRRKRPHRVTISTATTYHAEPQRGHRPKQQL